MPTSILDLMNNVENGFEQGRARAKQSKLADLFKETYTAPVAQRPALLGQIAGVGGLDAATNAQSAVGQMDDRKHAAIGRAAQMILAAPEGARPGLWSQIVSDLSAEGITGMKPDYDPVAVPKMAQQIAQAYGSGARQTVQSQKVGADGYIYTTMRDGTMVNTGIKADRQSWFRDQPGIPPSIVGEDGGVVPVGGQGVGGGAAAPRPEVSAAEQQRLGMEYERIRLAEEAAARAEAAAAAGNVPTGYRRTADGQGVEVIPGYTPPVAQRPPSQAELTAEGYYQRMDAAERDMDATVSAGYDAGNYRDYATAGQGPFLNWASSDLGQQYRQKQEDWVRAKLRKESGAVIGADEMEREIKTYFPQPGDGENVIRKKKESRRIAIDAMRKAANRAHTPANPPASATPNDPLGILN